MLLVYIGMFFFSSYSHTPFSPLYTYTSNTYSYKHLISQLFSGNGK
jgi:hypothetical protein